MKRYLKLKGFVLKKRILLGKDLLITFFSYEEGKIKILAKGIRKITSKRISYIQTGNYLNIGIYLLNKRYFLRDASLISAFSSLKLDLERVGKMYILLSMVDGLLPEGQREELVFDWLKRNLSLLARDRMSYKCLLNEIKKLVFILGFSKEEKISNTELDAILSSYMHLKLSDLMI